MNYMPPAAAAEAQTIIDSAAREAGRDPGEIRRIYNMSGAFTAAAPAPARDTDEAIVGPPDHWAEVLAHFALDLRFRHVHPDRAARSGHAADLHRGRRAAGPRARRDGAGDDSEGAELSGPETERGRAMFEELLWVHSIIRRDLEIVEQLAADVDEGLSGEAVRDALGELKTNGPLWQLKVNCLRYCRHVHAHHGAEDVLLFPALRAADSSVGPVVDRFEADHARVSDLLDVVEAAARALTDTDGGDARQRVIDGLRDLHVHLLEHLDYEEHNAGPTMRRLERLEAA